MVPLFAALGDEARLRLVSRLSEGRPLSIARLTAGSDVTRQAITRHLNVLADAGLVHGSRQGRERLFALDPMGIRQARRYLDVISRQWDAAMDRLKRAVEEEEPRE